MFRPKVNKLLTGRPAILNAEPWARGCDSLLLCKFRFRLFKKALDFVFEGAEYYRSLGLQCGCQKAVFDAEHLGMKMDFLHLSKNKRENNETKDWNNSSIFLGKLLKKWIEPAPMRSVHLLVPFPICLEILYGTPSEKKSSYIITNTNFQSKILLTLIIRDLQIVHLKCLKKVKCP